MTIHWKSVEQCYSVVLFDFQFYPVCYFGKFINFTLGTVRSERVNATKSFHKYNSKLKVQQHNIISRIQESNIIINFPRSLIGPCSTLKQDLNLNSLEEE